MFFLTLAAAAGFWQSFRPATCLPGDCFCETVGEGVVRQPANTWSSLAFVCVALWLALNIVRNRGPRRSTLKALDAWLLVASLLIVGLGSAFYHASLTFVGQVIDVSGMYLLATFILLHRLGPKWRISPTLGLIGFVTANAILMVAQVTTPSLRRAVFGGLLVTAIVVEWRATRAGRIWLGTGGALLAIAFLIWGVDRLRLVCAPESVIQGHAIWHLLGALAALCLVKRYEAEGLASTSSGNRATRPFRYDRAPARDRRRSDPCRS